MGFICFGLETRMDARFFVPEMNTDAWHYGFHLFLS